MPDEQASDTSTLTMDYDAAADRIGASLGEDYVRRETTPAQGTTNPPAQEPPAQPTATEALKTYEVPKSWRKEMHEKWGTISPDAQKYIIEREEQLHKGFQTFRPIQDAITPHQEFLAKAGLAPADAVQRLLTAQRRLVEGTDEQKWQAFRDLARHLGYEQRLQAAQADGQANPAVPVDPAVQAMQQRLDAIEQQAQAQWEDYKAKIREENQKTVDTFAADTKAHPYFDEVANELTILIMQGYSLQDAYPIAVRMNPTVWAKEEQRLLTEAEAKWKETARLNSLPKRKASSVNISSNGDGPEPTEPLGSFEDTIRSEHKRLKTRS